MNRAPFTSPTGQRTLVASALALMAGCGVTMKNLTAPSYPYEGSELLAKSPYLYATQSPSAVVSRFTIPERGFYLEVAPKALTSIKNVWVYVNGAPHLMKRITEPGRGGLYFFDSPCTCRDEFRYYFVVDYRVLLWTSSSALASPGEAFEVRPRGWEHIYWYNVTSTLHYESAAEAPTIIRLDRQTELASSVIIIENLRAERVALYGVTLVDAVGATHNDEFQLSGVPSNASGLPQPPASAYYLDCGQALTFTVTHTGTTEGAVGAFSMHAYNEDGDMVFSKLVYVEEANLNPP